MLQKSLVPVIFEGSLDQKSNYKLTASGKFLTLQNAVRRKTGLLEKRFGFTALSKTWFNPNSAGGTLSKSVGLAPYKDNLVLFDGSQAYLYASAQSAWSSVRTDVVNNITSGVFAVNGIFMTSPDICKVGKYLVCAWLEPSTSTKTIFYAIYEDITYNVIVPPTSLVNGAGTNFPRVAAFGASKAFIGYRNSGTSKFNWAVIDLTTPHTSPSTVVYAGVSMDDLPWDMVSYDATKCLVAYSVTGATDIRFLAINATGLVAGEEASFGTAFGGPITLVPDSANNRFYLIGNNATDLNAYAFNGTTYAISASVTLAAPVAGNSYARVTGVAGSDGTVYVFADNGNATMQNHLSRNQNQFIDTWTIAKWSGAGAPVKTDVLVDHKTLKPQSLVSKAFWDGTSAFVYTAYESGLQSTYYVARHDGHIVSRFGEGAASGLWKEISVAGGFTVYDTNSFLPSVPTDTNSRNTTILGNAVQIEVDFTNDGYTNKPILDFSFYSFNSATPQVVTREFQGLLYQAGGIPKSFDGSFIVEEGFNHFPEYVTLVGAAGFLVDGTYTVAVTYEWYDSTGLRHQSSPSSVVPITLGGGGIHSINVTTPLILNMSEYPKNEGRTSGGTALGTRAVIWVSAPNAPDTLYRSGTTTTSTYQISNVDTTAEILYTTGGIVPNDPAPSCTCLHVHKNRLWLGGLVTSQIAYSKTLGEGKAVGFSDNLRINVESEGGDVTAFGSLDDKLIIFKSDRFYYIIGEGPLDTLQQNDYPEPIRIPSTVGTVYPNSVIEIPTGLMFKSQKGWMILRRNLSVEYIGSPVEDFNSLTVTSASIVQSYNEVRFTHSDGSLLVYNMDFGQWMEWTNYTSVGGVAVASGYYHAKADGTVNQEIIGQYNDNGTIIDLVSETSWLSMARLQGFQRLWEMLLIGDFFNNFHLKISIAYDFQTSYNQVITKDTTGLANGPILQFRIQPAIQKCESFKVKIEIIDDIVGGGGANFKPTALTLAIGRKRGVYKLSGTNTI